ncbi:UTRA domain-containing protein [Pseudodonghicola xiamenensis]|uniref:Histidine utilization repressor n=1 Tax=Pseudodonghicola xiamenensis TaxID=337702 RepID=A0A8J3H4N9_9RHOB|nr:UTRA domain-containing protein [Pseudodonghicola xiamenensis]GHG86281.1 histidine utilization repressor [Pseudodonghicola xiamenensis]
MTSVRQADTHHARILEDLRQKIVEGVWQPGYHLAKETELAESYGVSRMTMNKVLTQLAQEGFLIRRKRRGTFVAQPRAQSAVMEINDIEEEVQALGLPYDWKLLQCETRTVSELERRSLDVPSSEDIANVLYIQGLHLARQEPFCLETRIINLNVVTAAQGEDFSRQSPGIWLLKSMPWSKASHKVRAINASGRDAKLLELPVGGAGLEILRKTKVGQDWVTYVRLLYPGEMHQLVAEFEPGLPAGGAGPRS